MTKWKDRFDLCVDCTCNPCQCHTPEQAKAKGQRSYDERKNPQPAPTAPKKKKKTVSTPKKSKSKFTSDWRKKNPTGSDAQLKTALKAAGYNVGCGVVAILLLSTPVGGLAWSGYEIMRIITG